MTRASQSDQEPSENENRSPPRLLTLILLTGLSVLTLNMFLPSLAQMAESFDVSYGLISVSVGGYMFISAFLQLVTGPLSDIYGRRPVILGGMALFVLASIGAALSTHVYVFLAFRLLQAAVITGMTVGRAVVRDISQPQEAARLLGVIGTAMALAPLLGPVLGGVLGDAFGWRANFVAFALFGCAMLALCWFDLGETNKARAPSFGAQFRAYPELLRARSFWAYSGVLTFSLASFYAFLGGAALVGETVFDLTPAELGFGMGSTSAGFMLGTYLTSRFAPRFGMMRFLFWGRWISTLGPLAAIALLAVGLFSPFTVVAGAVAVGLGNGLTVPSANAGVLSVAPHLAGGASGLSGALSVLGGALAASLTGALAGGPMGAYVLLAIMALCSGLGLVSVFWVRALERS